MFRFQKFADYYVGKIERGRGGRPAGGAPAQRADGFDPFADDADVAPEKGEESAVQPGGVRADKDKAQDTHSEEEDETGKDGQA